MQPDDVFLQIAAVLLLAAVVGGIATLLKQPLIVAFIAVGILAGPSALNMVEPNEILDLLAKLGIALLLFVVGLKLDVALIKRTGRVALATGMGQVFFTSVVGFLIALALGYQVVTGIYIAVALTFSSTIIIVKLLSDKKEIDELHGRIAIGFLIVQDIVVVLVMILLTAIGAGEDNAASAILLVFVKGLALLAFVGLVTRFFAGSVLHRISRSSELLVLGAIAWAVALAAGSELLGFSEEVGAFLAGVSIASTPYRDAVGARLVTLRDFLLLFFFIDLGARLDLGAAIEQLGPSLIFSAFVLIGNPLIVLLIMGYMGYRRRIAFLAGLTVAQISEFSLILGSLGMSLGHIDQDTMGLITMVGVITIGLSTYLILYSEPLFQRLEHPLGFFERSPKDQDVDTGRHTEIDIIVLGLGRYGGNITKRLVESGVDVLGVDFDPDSLTYWEGRGIPTLYGDAEDPELPTYLPLSEPDWIISTVPRLDGSRALVHALRHHGYTGKIALTAHDDEVAEALAKEGVDLVLTPFRDAAVHLDELIHRQTSGAGWGQGRASPRATE